MALTGSLPAADGSDIIAVQKYTNPSGASQNVVVRGFPVDQGGYVGGASTGLNITNTQVGNFSGNY